MPDPVKEETPASEEVTPKPDSSPVLSGISGLLDGGTHVGVAVTLSSGSGVSTLMIPDVTGISKGQPVFITRPIVLQGKNLKDFFTAKGITLDKKVTDLIADTEISCQAFYYSTSIMLMVFQIKFDQGLIASLTGDASLGALFDVKGASLRLLKCPEASLNVLQKYAAGLSAQSA